MVNLINARKSYIKTLDSYRLKASSSYSSRAVINNHRAFMRLTTVVEFFDFDLLKIRLFYLARDSVWTELSEAERRRNLSQQRHDVHVLDPALGVRIVLAPESGFHIKMNRPLFVNFLIKLKEFIFQNNVCRLSSLPIQL